MNINEGSIVERWSVLVPEASEEGPGVLATIEENLEAVAVPGLVWQQESISTGLIKALTGKRRDALHISYRPMPEWHVVVMVHPFGKSLHVTWLVVVTPRLTRDIRRAVRIGEERKTRHVIGVELDALQALDLSASLAITKHATKLAVEALGLEREVPVEDYSLVVEGVE